MSLSNTGGGGRGGSSGSIVGDVILKGKKKVCVRVSVCACCHVHTGVHVAVTDLFSLM